METTQGKEIIFVMTFKLLKNDLTFSRLIFILFFRCWLFFENVDDLGINNFCSCFLQHFFFHLINNIQCFPIFLSLRKKERKQKRKRNDHNNFPRSRLRQEYPQQNQSKDLCEIEEHFVEQF